MDRAPNHTGMMTRARQETIGLTWAACLQISHALLLLVATLAFHGIRSMMNLFVLGSNAAVIGRIAARLHVALGWGRAAQLTRTSISNITVVGGAELDLPWIADS